MVSVSITNTNIFQNAFDFSIHLMCIDSVLVRVGYRLHFAYKERVAFTFLSDLVMKMKELMLSTSRNSQHILPEC